MNRLPKLSKSMKDVCSRITSPILISDSASKNILFLNETAEHLVGYSENELLGKKLDVLFDSTNFARIQAVYDIIQDRYTKKLTLKENLIELKRKSGRRAHVNMSFSLENQILVITFEDIGDLLKIQKEKEKIQTESFRISKMADIGRLAGGIAHELNNPLGIILGYVENIDFILSEDKMTRESIKENLDPIHKSVLRMSRIVSKLIAMFRQEESSRHAVPVQKIIDETLLLLEDSLLSHSISLKVQIQDKWVKADSDQIVQVLINIINNAINALDEKKENREIRIASRIQGPLYLLEITNNGIEIPAAVKSKLFTPFFTTKDVGEGTGLGLYLCYNILKGHSGNITFNSNEKETTFSIQIPYLSVEDIPKNNQNKTIMLVDDDTFFRKILSQKLTRLGYQCVEFHHGEQAIEYFRMQGHTIFSIFSDFKMPKMDGVQFFKKVRDLDPTIPFVFISGFLAETEIQKLLKQHPDCRGLSKPIVNSELKLVLSALNYESEATQDLKKKRAA